ncbi:MAG: nucleotidyltransferase [Chloroflexota bacterium]|nr:nucleotidyltransferase [Chloroflexota bacterium]
MKLVHYFDSFLKETVNLNQTRLELLDARVQSIVVTAGLDEVIGPILVGYIPQGSWAHRTIIKPVGRDEYDADFLLELEEDENWSDDPKCYVEETEAAFRRSTTYKEMVRQKTRCVRIGYAGACHVDVVPYIVRADGSRLIINRETNSFEETNPEGFTAWMKEKDDLVNGHLRRVIRLAKYIRDAKGTFTCPSVILTTLLGERVQAWDAKARYPDVPTALKNLVSDLDAWLQLNTTRPTIDDPSCPGTNFDHRWDDAQYANFRTQIHRYSDWITTAYDEPDRDKSIEAWQKVFGPTFKVPPASALVVESMSKPAAAVVAQTPGEEDIRSRFPVVPTRSARVTGRVLPKPGFRSGLIRDLGRLHKNRELRFRVETDVAWPYDVYWKVRNFGEEAARANGLRGELMKASDPRGWHRETTLYTGTHWIEAYVVKDGTVRATDRHIVRIA